MLSARLKQPEPASRPLGGQPSSIGNVVHGRRADVTGVGRKPTVGFGRATS
jgi:hypothetical protein